MARNSPSMVPCPDGVFENTVKDYDTDMRKPKKHSARGNRKSILERFDKMATTHIEEHKRVGGPLESLSSEEESQMPEITAPSGGRRPLKSLSRTLASSVSNIDILGELNDQYDHELAEAVDKLIRAEEAARFTEMMIAAEAAVAAAPPELAEEAALAVTREYRTEKIVPIKEEIQGDTIIEVVGYVGVRKPKSSSKKSFCAC